MPESSNPPVEVDPNIFKEHSRETREAEIAAGEDGGLDAGGVGITKELLAGLLVAIVGAAHLTRGFRRYMS